MTKLTGADRELIAELFPNEPMYQNSILYDAAYKAERGIIVELGTYHGRGAICLALGTKASGKNLSVYTVDDYSTKKGWIGEEYKPEDKKVFISNKIKSMAYVQLVQCDIGQAANMYQGLWEVGIAVLYWDAGVMNRFYHDFQAWSKYVLAGEGFFIIKDTPEGHLGTFDVIDKAFESGEWKLVGRHKGITTMWRK